MMSFPILTKLLANSGEFNSDAQTIILLWAVVATYHDFISTVKILFSCVLFIKRTTTYTTRGKELAVWKERFVKVNIGN